MSRKERQDGHYEEQERWLEKCFHLCAVATADPVVEIILSNKQKF